MPKKVVGKSTRVNLKGKTKEKEAQKTNPFEQKVNRTKFKIQGRRLKGTESNIGQSRSRAIENRKKTLLVELEQKGKVNEFEDNRIGELDPNLSQEQKSLIRYQKEIKKRYSKGMFNLDDEESEELTHMGTNLGEISNLDDYRGNSDDEEAEDALDKELVSKLHFGGFRKVEEGEEGEEKQKSRDQIYAEIIAKSKAAKREKAKGKQEMEELTDKLDLDFAELSEEMSKMKREKLSEEEKKEKGMGKTDYDISVRELAFEMRAKPTDRTKKPEEIAKEEAEKLEELEKERLKRMSGDFDENSESVTTKKSKNVVRSADSMEDDYVPDDKVEAISYKINSDDESEEESEEKSKNSPQPSDEEEEEDGEEGEEEEEEENSSDLEDDEEVKEDENSEENSVEKKKKKLGFSKGKEIPFTFAVPKNHGQFLEWVEERNVNEFSVIIQRIRTCNHPTLHADNKKKMEDFCEVLLEHFFYLSSSVASLELIPIPFLDILTKNLFELKEIFGDRFFHIVRDRVLVFQEALTHKLNVEKGAGSCWPSFGHLLFFQLITKIFPVSDFQHFAVTPALLLLNQYLSQCPVKNQKEYSIALFVANLIFHYIKSTKRYSPEAVRFLINGIASFHGKGNGITTIPKAFLQFKEKNSQKLKNESLSLSLFAGTYKEKKELFQSDQWRLNAFRGTLSLLSQFIDLYSDRVSFSEISTEIQKELEKVEKKTLNSETKKEIDQFSTTLKETGDKCIRTRKPMKFIVQKPKEIRQLTPKFQEGYMKKKGLDEQQVVKNLQKAVKKQRKGATRELKKDNSFLQAEKSKKRRAEAEEREKKRKKIMSSLETQQSELKLSEKLKKKGNPKGKSAF